MSRIGIVRAVNAVRIQLPSINAFHPNVPDVASMIVHRIQVDDPCGHRIFGMVEKLQSNPRGVTAKEGEIDSPARLLGAQR